MKILYGKSPFRDGMKKAKAEAKGREQRAERRKKCMNWMKILCGKSPFRDGVKKAKAEAKGREQREEKNA
jgi:hypothetical protein